MDYKRIIAKKQRYKSMALKHFPFLRNTSGIYIFTRYEGNFKYAYVGQAKNLLERTVSHLMGYNQHIDKSLKKHKLYSIDNPTGWQMTIFECEESQLNELETKFIEEYANKGYQLRNKTSGSQGKGKFGIADNKEAKGYRDGVEYGKKKILDEIKVFFDKYLDFVIKGKPNKIKERKFEELKRLLGGTNED